MDRTPNSRDEILALFRRERLANGRRIPCFSGLINVTVAGLNSLGWRLPEVHRDAGKMARAAATSYRLFGLESATVPFDLCVEAEALGAQVDFREDDLENRFTMDDLENRFTMDDLENRFTMNDLENRFTITDESGGGVGAGVPMLPITGRPAADSPADLKLPAAARVPAQGRIPLVVDAIGRLKADVGREIVVGAYMPGPFTLAMYVLDNSQLLPAVIEDMDTVGDCLDKLVEILAEVASAYRTAGADFITVHEMGGSPGYLGLGIFRNLILPRLQRLTAALPAPRVLSVCGRTNRAMSLLASTGADALSVDQLNDLSQSRQTLGPGVLLFGNIDPVETLAGGQVVDVERAVATAVAAGVDAIWPGCDLWPEVPAENMRAMVKAASSVKRGT